MPNTPEIIRTDKPDPVHDQLDEFVSSENAIDALQEQTDSMAESARIMENHWKPRNRLLVGIFGLICSFGGFLVADYGNVRLFSTAPEAEIDGQPATEEEIAFLRSYRKSSTKYSPKGLGELAKHASKVTDRLFELRQEAKAMDESLKQAPEMDKATARAAIEASLEKMFPKAKHRKARTTIKEDPLKVADNNNVMLKEGQSNDVSSGSDSGADIR